MKTTKEPQRAWLYARVPGNYVESKNTLNVLMLQAQRDGAEVVGWGYDIHHGWLRRPAYRRMMREAKAGHIERIYICRMSQISGQERHLISFFRRLMRYKVNVIATEYALNLKVPAYHMGTIIDEICARKGWERPWFVSESSEFVTEVDGSIPIEYTDSNDIFFSLFARDMLEREYCDGQKTGDKALYTKNANDMLEDVRAYVRENWSEWVRKITK